MQDILVESYSQLISNVSMQWLLGVPHLVEDLVVGINFLQPTFNNGSTSPLAPPPSRGSGRGQLLGVGEVNLFSNSFLGGELDILWQQFSPIAITKYDLAAADQSSRQADTRQL